MLFGNQSEAPYKLIYKPSNAYILNIDLNNNQEKY